MRVLSSLLPVCEGGREGGREGVMGYSVEKVKT
jgi:hypothetical protein